LKAARCYGGSNLRCVACVYVRATTFNIDNVCVCHDHCMTLFFCAFFVLSEFGVANAFEVQQLRVKELVRFVCICCVWLCWQQFVVACSRRRRI